MSDLTRITETLLQLAAHKCLKITITFQASLFIHTFVYVANSLASTQMSHEQPCGVFLVRQMAELQSFLSVVCLLNVAITVHL